MNTPRFSPLWLGAALLGHTAWGIYPVLARYLQIQAEIPGLTLLTIANGFAMLVMFVVVAVRGEFRQLTIHAGWLVALFAMLRAVTNVLAARYAPAAQVTLIGLLTPLLVVIMGRLWFHDPAPPKTGIVLTLSLLGAVVMLSGDIQNPTFWQMGGDSSWVGIVLALVSSVMLALYMLSVRRTSGYGISSEATFLLQLIAVVGTSIPLSYLIGERFDGLSSLMPVHWLWLIVFSVCIVIGANILQVYTLRKLGASLVTAVQAWRLPVSAIVAGFILGEWIETPTEYIGAALTALSVTWYLVTQRKST
ncbi:MAG: DMT family transporter [Chloroflexi bacterium]|nr:MAG: DMT family transporter [Chloroflexota bacterium]